MKLKKAFWVALVAAMLTMLFALAANAESWFKPDSGQYSSGKYTYNLINNGKEVEIACFPKISGAVKIPAKIDGKPVTSIGFCAFYENTEITSVTIPNGVTEIGMWTFADCNNLITIIRPVLKPQFKVVNTAN